VISPTSNPGGIPPEDRLAELASLLAEAILRSRVRTQRRLRNSEKRRKDGLDVQPEIRTHGRDIIRRGEKP